MTTVTLSKHDVNRATGIGLPPLKHWGERGLIARPYNVVKTFAVSVGAYLSDRGLAIEIIRGPVALIAGKTEDELLANFARGETRLTLDTDSGECTIEAPSAVARRVASDDARIISIPLRTAYQRVLLRLNNLAPSNS